MTKEQIRTEMIKLINSCIDEVLHDENVLALCITKDDVYDYMHGIDFGRELATAYIDENMDELAEEYLDEIFRGIDTSDLYNPW